jgi:DNA-directed RNA polymerase subunit delta
MKNTQALLKEAIADAKAVRETALTQAKLALEEAFAPRISQMFATRLQEEYDLEEEDLVDETMDFEKEMEENYSKDTMDDLDEIDLDEILAELNNELNEAKEDDDEDVEEEEVEDDEFEMDKGKDEKDKKVEDLTL